MSYKKTILQLQRMLIEADAEVELKQVKSTALEDGCEAVDLVITNEAEFLAEHPPCGGILELLGGIISQEFEDAAATTTGTAIRRTRSLGVSSSA